MSKVFSGSEIKLNVSIEPIQNKTMDDYHFSIDVYTANSSPITIDKEDAIRVDNSNYIILIDTAKIGYGRLKCKVTAEIPDLDFKDDGKRTEVVYVETGVDILKGA